MGTRPRGSAWIPGVAITYPPATATCAEADGDPASDLWMSKTASTSQISAGDTFTYSMKVGNRGLGGVTGLLLIDDVPDVLRIISVKPATAATAGDPGWVECVVADRLPNGFGGTITCELDRELGYNQVAPDVLLTVELSPTAPAGPVVNTARVTAYELPKLTGTGAVPLTDLVTLALQDSAIVMTPGRLANTGTSPLLGAQLALVLLVVGGVLVTVRRRRPRHA